MVSKRTTAMISLQHLEGKYEILEKMREGGMGAVYKVRHRLLDEIRVIKVMRPHLAKDAVLRARFVREAKTAIRLRHANLAQLYDFTVDEDGNAFIVMEYIPGITLVEMLKVLGSPDLGLAIEISCQSLDVLGYLHRKGVIHRDISPDNLLLTRDDEDLPQVKLIDLGIAKVAKGDDNLTTAGTFLGKVRYSSPEHFKARDGAEVDERSDLYSLGVVIYELLTGRYPIMGSDTTSIMAGHLLNAPYPFAETDPGGVVPEEVRAAVLTALAKSPEDRFADAAELARALEPFRQRFPVSADRLRQVLEASAQETRRIKVGKNGSTQQKLDRQFGLVTTPPHQGDAANGNGTANVSVQQQVTALLRGAGKLVQLQHFEEATLQLSSVLELDPGNHEAEQLMTEVRRADAQVQAQLDEGAGEVSALLAAGELAAAVRRHDQLVKQLGTSPALERLEADIAAARQEQQERLALKQQLIDRALQASADHEHAAAIELYEQAVAVDPDDRQLRRQLKQARQAENAHQQEQRRQQEVASTVGAINACIEQDQLEEALRSIEVAEKLYGAGEPFAGLREQLELAHDRRAERQAEELRQEAGALVEQGDFAAAIELLEQAQELVPQQMRTMRALASAKKALAEQEERRRRTEELRHGVEQLLAAGRLSTALDRVRSFAAEQGELPETVELQATIEQELALEQERSQQIADLLARAHTMVDADDFEGARALLHEAAPYEQERLEVRDQIEEIGAAIRRRAEERRTAKELARAAESIEQRLAEGALADAERELVVAERVFGNHEVIGELRRQLDQALLRQRQERAAELLARATAGEQGFTGIVSLLEQALELDPDNEQAQQLLAETRSQQQSHERERQQRAIDEVLCEVDELIWRGQPAAALDRIDQAVKQLGEFREARAIRYHLGRALGTTPPPVTSR